MSKLLFILCALSFQVSAQNLNEALKARDEALSALKGFNPGSVLKGYTQNPEETKHLPQEGTDSLRAFGLNALPNNRDALEVYQQAGTRPKTRYNPNSSEMSYAEKLLENPDEVLNGVCYTSPSHCEQSKETKTCQEHLHYQTLSCGERLNVTLKPQPQKLIRWASFRQGKATFNLTQCDKHDRRCSQANLMSIYPACEGLNVVVMRKNRVLTVTKQPTCKDPSLSIAIQKLIPKQSLLELSITQWISEESWVNTSCDKRGSTSCSLIQESTCLEPNASKIIQGIPITRTCWGRASDYRCSYLESSECTPLLTQGCSQTGSQCLNASQELCEHFLQTFSCMNEVCVPEKTICPDKIPFSDGSCDLSTDEASDDAAEGLSRLGVLAAAAGEVASNQIHSGMPAIFAGANSQCRKVFGDLRNCCGGSYEMTHCSEAEKQLAKAKEEGRAYPIGSYCAQKVIGCVEEKESWCVFPTKLSAIIQIQGRHHQLGIHFGWARDEENHPNCRGITPEELERINFSALNLSPIEQELMNKRILPHDGQISTQNQTHIERLKEMGFPHD